MNQFYHPLLRIKDMENEMSVLMIRRLVDKPINTDSKASVYATGTNDAAASEETRKALSVTSFLFKTGILRFDE